MSLVDVVRLLNTDCTVGQPGIGYREVDSEDLEALLEDTVKYIVSSVSFDRRDRHFPAAPQLFQSNPLSIAYGACVVAYALKVITGSVPQEILDWILSHDVAADRYPPGT